LISAKDYKLLSLFYSALTNINDANVLLEILLSLEQAFGLDQKMNREGEESIIYRFEQIGGIDKLEEV
jgi:hypothetical protein